MPYPAGRPRAPFATGARNVKRSGLLRSQPVELGGMRRIGSSVEATAENWNKFETLQAPVILTPMSFMTSRRHLLTVSLDDDHGVPILH
jgi:hypothetical protein